MKKDENIPFLTQIVVQKFSESTKLSTGERKVITYDNWSPDDIYTIIGITYLKEGQTLGGWDEPFYFKHKRTVKVYIVANRLHKRLHVQEQHILTLADLEDDE